MEAILKQALKILAEDQGCPADEDFLRQNTGCEKCSEDQELTECWLNFITWELNKR